MPYRNLSLDDFARHVGMDPQEVRKLSERGKLPGQKIGGEWRFNRARVTEWLQQEMHTFENDRLLAIERAMGGDPGEAPTPQSMVVTDLIGLEGIDIALPANTRASVLREMIRLAEKTGLLYDSEGLLAAVEQREGMCSTALPNGIAIPHPRQPMPYVSAEPLICIGRPTREIPFGSPYGGLTRLFFLICCHEDRHHLRVLARLMRILDGGTIESILAAESPEELLRLLIEKEKTVIAGMV